MNTVSLIGSVSRRAGGLFESVRRLHQELIRTNGPSALVESESRVEPSDSIQMRVLGIVDEFTAEDQKAWAPVPLNSFRIIGNRSFGFTPGMLKTLWRAKPDLLHVHGLWQFTSLAAQFWHQRWRKPYLVSPHGMLDSWALRNSRWKKRLGWMAYERRHLSCAGCIRVLCKSEAEAVRALGIQTPICVIPNGVDLPDDGACLSSPRAEGEFEWVRERKLLLYLGRIHPKKGLVPLLRAWAQLGRRTAPWVLGIAGWEQGGHETELKELATELGICWGEGEIATPPGASLVFLGPQYGASKKRWLRRCQASVLPSFSEGLPMSVLEAWAYAKPVLISPQCNLPEGLSAGAAISIEPVKEKIAAGLSNLVTSPDSTLVRMGQRGRELVSAQFSWPGIAMKMRSIYRWMLGNGPAPSCVLRERSAIDERG